MTIAFDSENPESHSTLTRRDFAKALGSVAIAASFPIGLRRATASSHLESSSESAVARFHGSLNAEQRKTICFPFDHPLRRQVSNNWAIVRPAIRDLTNEQQALCREVFENLCSDEGHDRFLRQMKDDYGGFDRYHVAVFGEPGTANPFEWVLTGRHNTLRADGNRAAGAGIGDPIFYGHASPVSGVAARNGDNVWWYQGELANKVFQSLDEPQRARALVTKVASSASRLKRRDGEPIPEAGLTVSRLDGPQKALVQDLVEVMLSPFRAFEVPEVQKYLHDPAATDMLRLTYFNDEDLGRDGLCNIWKLEGPSFAWYFHGSPHVHAWLNVNGSVHEGLTSPK
jgi:Protein of unknown function (DUF3500)